MPYVPPHKRHGSIQAAVTQNQEQFQVEYFSALKRSIVSIINKVSASTVLACSVELLRENLIRGRGLFVKSLMALQETNGEMSAVCACLVATINKNFPTIGNLLVRRVVYQWHRLRKRRDTAGVVNQCKFIAQLVVFRVLSEQTALQILSIHLSCCDEEATCTVEDIEAATSLFRDVFKAVEARNPSVFRAVLEPMRELLQFDPPILLKSSQASVSALLEEVRQWQKHKAHDPIIPPCLSLVGEDDESVIVHMVDVDQVATINLETHLDVFQHDEEFSKHEEEYDEMKAAVLGDLAVVVPPSEDKNTEDSDASEGEHNDTAALTELQPIDDRVQLLAQSADVLKLQKEVFLCFRSSLRADEVAHKIMKLVKRGTGGVQDMEHLVCNLILDAMVQEKSYKSVYAMTSERLCKTTAKFQHFFSSILKNKYSTAEDLSAEEIEATAKLSVHLLRTDSISWQLLAMFDLSSATRSQRLFIQDLLVNLTGAMTLAALKRRMFQSEELKGKLGGLFPLHDAAAASRAVKLLELMGPSVALLASELREYVDSNRSSKRSRDE